MKKITLMVLFWASALTVAMAQKITVSGKVLDGLTQGDPLPFASVTLLTPKDSTMAAGVQTGDDGSFKLPAVAAGNYILRITYVGYQTIFKDLTLTKENRKEDAGIFILLENAKLMKEAEVTARAAQVEMKEDTFVYNSSAYRLPEGSNLEELVRKLPGAEVGDDGTIKINGKTVSKIMVGGKEFFNNDTQMAMKNLPTKMIDKIKAYDRKSDYTRITGIDDGEEETVLDLTVKKGMKEGWLLNTDVGYGTEDRYTGKLNLSRFTDHLQMTLLGSINNVNDNGFPGGGGRGWGGGGGIVTSKMAGFNFAWDNNRPDYSAGLLKLGGNIRYNHRRTSSLSLNNSEQFLDNVNSTFNNSRNWSLSSNANLNANFQLEWQIDSLTNLMFRPNFSHSESKNRGLSTSVTFNTDPYAFMNDPLTQYNLEENQMVRDSITVNDNVRENMGSGHSNYVDGNVQLNRRLMKPGRNVTLNMGGAYSHSENESFSRAEINYYRKGGSDFTNQFNLSPSTSYNYQGQVSYAEPIIGGLSLQASYQFQYRFSDNDRSMYSIDSLLTKYEGYYTQEQLYLGYLPGLDSLNYVKNVENSQYATYKEYNQDIRLMLRFIQGEQIRLNMGASLQPQTTHMDYTKHMLDTTVVRHIMNWSPRIDFRWKISNTSQLRVRYNGRMSQPSMTDLLEVTDNSNPLNISTGNAGLESSWTNRFNIFYNNFITDRQMGWMVNADYSQMKNNISSATIYNTETGARYTRPMNIDGNWNTNMHLMFNSALGPQKYFNVHTFTSINYANNVGYQSSNSDGREWGDIFNPDGTVDMDKIFRNTPLDKSTTKTTSVNENLRLNFRNDFLELGVNGGINYMHAYNKVQTNANLDTWTFNYGGNMNINFPWSMQLASDISKQSRRGYDDASMNTDELIWNAQLSQSFLKKKTLTLSVQWYDILRQRSNISRSISATMRSDSWQRAINSYVTFHVIYQLNLLGNKETRAQGMPMPGMGGPGGRGGNRGGGGGWGGPRF